jgi:hypothetical protein
MMPYREASRLDPAPVATLAAVLQPRSVAVIGASRHDGVGATALRNLIRGEYLSTLKDSRLTHVERVHPIVTAE